MAQFAIKNGLIQGTLAGTPTSGTLNLASLTLTLSTVPVAQGGTGLTALGTALQVIRVNAGATGLEYASVSVGGGDMVLADVQTVSGAKSFNAATLKQFNSGGTFTTTFATNATANRTATFPDASITVARTDAAQTFTGDQTIESGSLWVKDEITTGLASTVDGAISIYASGHAFYVAQSAPTLTANRLVTWGDFAGVVVLDASTQTLTNKTISGASNTLSNISLTSSVTGTLPVANGGTGITSLGSGVATWMGTPTFANLNSAVSDAELARTSGTNTFTGDQTFSNAVLASIGIVAGTANAVDGQIALLNENNAFGVYLTAGNTTVADQSWSFPDTAGDTAVFVARDLTQTLTNKTINGSDNTLTNIALSSIAQSSATTGQVPTWNGSSWAPATPSSNSGDIYLVLASDTANSTTSFADVTGLTFAVTSGETYVFEAWVVYETAATTTGSKWAVNGPASPTILSYSVETPTTGTTSRLDFASTYDGTSASSQTAGIGQCLAKIEGVVKVSASGTFALRFGSEVGSSAVTAKAGSSMRYRKIAP